MVRYRKYLNKKTLNDHSGYHLPLFPSPEAHVLEYYIIWARIRLDKNFILRIFIIWNSMSVTVYLEFSNICTELISKIIWVWSSAYWLNLLLRWFDDELLLLYFFLIIFLYQFRQFRSSAAYQRHIVSLQTDSLRDLFPDKIKRN